MDEAASAPAEDGAGSRLFASGAEEPRARRAGDAFLVGLGLALVAVNGVLSTRSLRIEEEIAELLDSLPAWTDEFFRWAYGLAAVFAIWLVLAAIVRRRRRWDVARDLGLAALVALVAALILVRLVDGAWPVMFPELGRAEPVPRFPVLRVAMLGAVVAAARPHVVRPVRRLGLTLVGLVALSGLGIGLGLPTDSLGGIGLGIAAGGAVLLLFGSPSAYPDNERVRADLSQLGLAVTGLRPAPQPTWGARTLVGDTSEGSVLVKVYGRDARDAQLFARLWRFLWYRDAGPSVSPSRIQQVEHEALVAMVSARAGVACPEVVVAAVTGDDDAVLVMEQRGRPLREMDPSDTTSELLVAVWAEVAKLHRAGIAHGGLDLSSVQVDGAAPVLTNFAAGSLSAPSDRRATDVAELLVSTADRVGIERAVSTARAGLGDGALAEAIPYLQLPALSRSTRRAIARPKDLVKEVQAATVAAIGVEASEPAEIRRVSVRDLALSGLMVLAAYFLIQQLTQLDLAAIWDSLRSAQWGWIIAGLVVAQLILIPNATGMVAAVSAPIPLRPTVVLQSAIQFIGLAVPSTAGRVATNVAFLRKFGVPPVTAITQGALDSFTGFLVQMAILAAALAFGELDLDFDGGFELDWAVVVVVVAVVIAAGGLAVYLVESLRTRVANTLGEVGGALRGLFREPRRAIVLFSSNFFSQLTLAITLWLMVRAFGLQISMATALVIVVTAFLLGGLAPTPGGIGVQEAMVTAGLVASGIDEDTAFAIAVTYRLATFYLPPIWGFFSLKWLETTDYL